MKKTIGTTLGLIASAGMALAAIPTAVAQSDNAATINKDFGCGFFVNTPEGPVFASGDSPTRVIQTSSGEVTGFCNIDVVFGEVSKTFILRDFPCGVAGQAATDSMLMVTPSGKASLRCSVHHGGN